MASDDANDYVLGHSAWELERLRRQAQLVNPITRQYLIEAGIAPGMHVLDVGSGAGDVTFLAAELVGPSGQVVGVDQSLDALDLARSRAKEQSLANVTFRQSRLSEVGFDQPFDAAIGRYVLCFQPDPAAVLRKIASWVRPGGIVLFHEPDRKQMRSYPPTPTYDKMAEWIDETFARTGMDVRMGIKLYSTFLSAGLAAPTMRLQAVIGGAKALGEVHFEADCAITLAAAMERTGVATGDELGADSLIERITHELSANQGVIVGRADIGAWTRLAE
jgi:ubiquinone/menaquinone biosynthesis C-methylase UbiE